MIWKYLLFILGVIGPALATASDAGCKENPQLIGQCYVAHGEVLLSADVGPVFVPLYHDKIVFIIRAAPNSRKDMPKEVTDILLRDLHGYIHGTYRVCPIPTQPTQFPPDYTHFVCIDSVSAIRVKHWSGNSEK